LKELKCPQGCYETLNDGSELSRLGCGHYVHTECFRDAIFTKFQDEIARMIDPFIRCGTRGCMAIISDYDLAIIGNHKLYGSEKLLTRMRDLTN
jgi:hypothetical protein